MNLIPLPKKVKDLGGTTTLPSAIVCPSALAPAAQTLIETANTLLGLTLSIVPDETEQAIRFLPAPDMADGAYRLAIGNRQVAITAPSVPAACHAVASLLQLLAQGSELPNLCIEDSPDCAWSSFMIDLARRWHPFDWLLRYVDLCFLTKIRVLHLHFTDDQGYRLPSRAYPSLPTPNAHYTEEEIAYLNEYANRRGVILMPEIDVPGHCTPFCTAYPEVFGAGPLIALNKTSMDAMRTLVRELCALFPDSPCIHIGGDEAAIDAWNDKPDCVGYAASVIPGFDPSCSDRRLSAEQMLARFVGEMADAVWANRRQPIAWEGFSACVNHLVSKELILYSWENYYQTTPELLDAGYRIINGSWNPNYVVTPIAMWPREEVFDWSIRRWKAVHPASPYAGKLLEVEPNALILGGGMLAWGDALISHFKTDEEACRAEWNEVTARLPIVAEHTWDDARRRTFAEFDAATLGMKRLMEALG